LPESSLSSAQTSDAVLTSRGLQTRLPIGPAQCLGHLHSENVDISASFDEFGQLSNGFCGDNLVAGKLASLSCCNMNGGIFFSGDCIISPYDDITVVSPVALSTSSNPCFTNSRVDAHELLMARTKQTAKNSSDVRQPGVTKAVKEFTCFVCGWTTEWPGNLKRHLARKHTLREDGTVASPSYRDAHANKRSLKWQTEHAVAGGMNCTTDDVESCAPPIPKRPKVKNVRRVGQVDEKGLLGVEVTHTIPLSGKIEMVNNDANFSASDALKAKAGFDPKLAQVTVPAHSATLSLPATDMETHTFDDIAALLDDELRSQEDALAVQSLFDTGLSHPDLFVMNEMSDIPLGLGWRWDSPVVITDDAADVVQLSDRTTYAGPKVDPVITKALKAKGARGATTAQRIVSSILSMLIDDVVHASPEALVGSILEDIIVKAVPRPLPESKKDIKKKERKVDPGTQSGSATSVEVSSRAKIKDKNVKKAATQNNVECKKKVNNDVCSKDKVHADDMPVRVRFDKGKRVAHVPLSVAGEDPTLRKPCAPNNPAPKPRVESHMAGSVGAMSASVPTAKSEDTKCMNVSTENATSRRKVATKSSKNANTSVCVTQKTDKVVHGNNDVRMNVGKTSSKVIQVAQTVNTTPSKTSAMRADPSFLAPVAIPRVVQSPPVASRKYLPRKTVAKYAWKLDCSTANVAALLKSVYGLSSPDESRMVDRVSDMRCAFKHMTARMREQSSIATVTEADRVAMYINLAKQLKFVEMYDDEDDA